MRSKIKNYRKKRIRKTKSNKKQKGGSSYLRSLFTGEYRANETPAGGNANSGGGGNANETPHGGNNFFWFLKKFKIFHIE